MALNPFFLQGSSGEQRIIQELINEQLKIYGVEVTYIPRKFVRKQTIIEEIQSSRFDDNFLLEAYVNTYDGYSGAGDIMTKFGVSLRDEITLTISRERYEDFIAPFLDEMPADEITVDGRPREGDLVFFPLGNRLFEVKFVEHEVPFYQLGKNYVYELKCELFEYEDEVIDTSIDAIDRTVEDQGYLIDLTLFSGGTIATATASVGTGYVSSIFLNDDGSGFTSTPTVSISTAPSGGTNATAVAITTTRNNVTSIKEILMTNAGAGYTIAPIITISGGGGTGAAATCGIITAHRGVVSITVNELVVLVMELRQWSILVFHHYLHRLLLLQKQLYLLLDLFPQFILEMLVLVSLVGHQTSQLVLLLQQALELIGSMNWLLVTGLIVLVMLRDGILIQINCVLVFNLVSSMQENLLLVKSLVQHMLLRPLEWLAPRPINIDKMKI